MTIRTTARIPKPIHEMLRKESFETGISQNEIIVESLKIRYEGEMKMKKVYFTDQEVIEGKNKADLGEVVAKVEYLEYEYLDRDIEAYTNEGSFTFRLTDDDFDRLEDIEELTAGDILNAGWDSLDISQLNY